MFQTLQSNDTDGRIRATNRDMTKLITPLFCVALTILFTHAAWGAELSIPELKARAGESVDIPIMFDQVDNLAGVKLIIEYDPKLLTFKKGSKTKHTDSMMHIINDKKPGKLIIVMAGARGIKGKAFSILTLTFVINKGLTEKKITQFTISGVELMTDQLKEIESEIKVNPLTILPCQKQIQKNLPKKEATRGAAPESAGQAKAHPK